MNETNKIDINEESAITHTDIINAVFNPDDDINIRVFDDRGNMPAMKFHYKAGLFEQHVSELKDLNAKNYGVFYVVNSGGDTDSEITKINAQFMECDDGTFEEQLAKIEAFPLRPSFIIKTRKSLHTYWLVKDADVSKFREVQLALIEQFGADPNCKNESRVLRLPDFYHCKEEPLLVKCIFFEPQNRYTQDELLKYLPEVDAKPIDVQDGTNEGLDIILNSCDFIKHCKDDSKTLSEHDWYAMITNLYPFKGGVKTIHEYSKDYDGYSKRTTDKKIKHFIESKTKPITCQIICDKGFKCKKFEAGECDCKSPAALCYKQISLDGLNSLLESVPVTNNPLTDIPAINKFVKQYMFNQDKAVAETFINYAIKDKFKLKAEDIKSIKASFNKLRKEYEATKNENFSTASLPQWYEITRSGYKLMPMILANHLKDTEKVIYVTQEHYKYGAGVYRPLDSIVAEHMVQDKLLPTEGKLSQIVDAEKQWRMKIYTDVRELNPNPYVINVRNGLYDVISDTLKPHDDKYLSTIQFNVNYDDKATCPLFLKYLNESLEGDTSQINLVQEMLGYLLVPITSAQRTFVIFGGGNTGKSVLLHVINVILLGKENVSNVTWQDLGDKFRTAQLFGKLANIFADLPTKNIDDTGIFKALVGEDLILCEEKFKKPFSFKSNARLVFSCNKIPISYNDKTSGFYRRLLIIPFNHVVKDVDMDLKKKLEAEADGIFNFALLGLRRLMANKYKFSETAKNIDAVERYRIESDSVLSFFTECCELCDGATMSSTQLYNNYLSYCEQNGVHHMSQKNMVTTLTTNYPSIESHRTKEYRTIQGVRVLDDMLNNL